MADNYLENKMDEYRSGKLTARSRTVHRVADRRNPGDFTLSFPLMRVVIFGGSIWFVEIVSKLFRQIESRVAICHTDSKQCTPLAQKHGLRYYPFDPDCCEKRMSVIDDLDSRWGGVDVVIDLRDFDRVEDDCLTSIATVLLLHSHPSFSFINKVEMVI